MEWSFCNQRKGEGQANRALQPSPSEQHCVPVCKWCESTSRTVQQNNLFPPIIGPLRLWVEKYSICIENTWSSKKSQTRRQ